MKKRLKLLKLRQPKTKTDVLGVPERDAAGETVKETETTSTSTTTTDDDDD